MSQPPPPPITISSGRRRADWSAVSWLPRDDLTALIVKCKEERLQELDHDSLLAMAASIASQGSTGSVPESSTAAPSTQVPASPSSTMPASESSDHEGRSRSLNTVPAHPAQRSPSSTSAGVAPSGPSQVSSQPDQSPVQVQRVRYLCR